ncbi:hypothetical protein JOB18_030714 [Solea senegalensis]|uniref:Uncharacterized protein n=1 Tax=Solea senegalensis TaxID=28829 RepID=A0AAV6RXJ0_SOLSE|nr:hypothetical protein JOB18_030714 [Solea senegalensis]
MDKTKERELHHREELLTRCIPAAGPQLDSKVKFTFLGCWEECCPLGLWIRPVDYKSGSTDGDWDTHLPEISTALTRSTQTLCLNHTCIDQIY